MLKGGCRAAKDLTCYEIADLTGIINLINCIQLIKCICICITGQSAAAFGMVELFIIVKKCYAGLFEVNTTTNLIFDIFFPFFTHTKQKKRKENQTENSSYVSE